MKKNGGYKKINIDLLEALKEVKLFDAAKVGLLSFYLKFLCNLLFMREMTSFPRMSAFFLTLLQLIFWNSNFWRY